MEETNIKQMEETNIKQMEIPNINDIKHIDDFGSNPSIIMNLMNFNMQYLVNNNSYREKINTLKKDLDRSKDKNYEIIEDFNELRADYSALLRKYKKLNPPDIHSKSKKRKGDDIVQPNNLKKKRKSKYSLKEEEINRIFYGINNIEDIINLENLGSKIYHDPKLIKLINIIPPLKKLQSMVGLTEIKQTIFNHILYFIQGLNYDEMYHTVISGPPGVGKTELGKILGSIYLGIGILQNDTFRIVKRSELIGKYLGHTAAQTQEIIDECKGGIMFIDEAYSLGNEEKKDSFSKECLDTINQNLTENKNQLMCIIAGYKDSLNKCFFSYNEGLKRRFPFWYDIKGYDSEELKEIFKRKVIKDKWELGSEVKSEFFQEKFEFYGGDIDTFTFYCKMAYSKRIFNNSLPDDKILIIDDLNDGYNTFNDSKDKLKEKAFKPPFGMYV